MDRTEFDQQLSLEFYKAQIQAVRDVGITALRTLITLNSGAFVVMLTFIGNTAAQSRFLVSLPDIRVAMFSFLIGIALAFAVIAYTYVITQFASPYHATAAANEKPYVWVSVAICAASLFAFLFGVSRVVLSVSISVTS